MERQNILFCLGLFVVASTVGVVVDPRGARPIEHGTKADKCDTQKEWPFCTDDDWGPKCPSGCRIQGLMDKYDHELLKKIEKIRALLADNQAKHRSADQDSKQTYDNLREKLILDAGNDNTYYDLAQNLRQRIVDMKIKIDRQLRTLGAMKDRVKDQVIQMQRLEVDIDMKLRSCKGSCQSYNEYSVDKDSYVALEKQVAQLDAQAAQSIETVSSMYVMKSRALKDVVVDTRYKAKQVVGAGDAGQTDDFFPDVKIVQLTLESEGASPSSPATVSKVPVCVRLRRQRRRHDGRQPHGEVNTHGRRQCPATEDQPLCSDDDWGSKCPSGCRLQGLISEGKRKTLERLQEVCDRKQRYDDTIERSMKTAADIYYSNRRDLLLAYVWEQKYVAFAEGLAGNLTSLRKRASALSRRLKELRGAVQEQIEELYRREVDIDMKLRACGGSCRSALPFSVDHPGHRALRGEADSLERTESRRAKLGAPSQQEHIPQIKLEPVDFGPPPSGEYKSIPMVQKELLTQFEDIEQNQVVLEDLLMDDVTEDSRLEVE